MTVPTCGTPHYDYSESLCTEPAGHYIRDRDPHAAPLIIDGRERGGLAWDEPERLVSDRHTVNSITSDALDELYDRLDGIRDAAILHRQRLIRTSELYAVIEADPPHSTKEAAMTDQTRKRITIDPPSEATILAARHLDATEGRVQIGSVVDSATRSAITTVLRYIAKAHNSPAAIPTRDEASRYDWLSPLARALVDDFDELDLAEMLVAAQDELAALRAVARSYCPACGRGDAAPTITDWEQQKQRAERAETILARIQALADEYPAGIDTALIHEALDQPAPAPAATEATERETTTRVFAALHRSAEQDVSRVIALYEQWVKAGPPPLGVSLARWWDACLAELHDAILPPMREQRERPTHADGTSYSYAEIRAEGWGYCEGCRMWSTGTPDPHQCPETHMRLATNQPKEK